MRHAFRRIGLVIGVVGLAVVGTMCSSCAHLNTVPQLVHWEAGTEDVVFHDVAVFTGTERVLRAHQDVRVHGDTILSIGPTAPAPSGVRVIEGAGKTLLPGLIDSHAHPTGTGSPFFYFELPDVKHNLGAHLYVGVTTVFAPGGDASTLSHYAKKTESGDVVGPQLFHAGRMITKKSGYPIPVLKLLLPGLFAKVAEAGFALQVSNAAEATAAAKKDLDEGASFLKVMVTKTPDDAVPRLSLDEIKAVADVAHGAGKLLVAHVDSQEDADLAVAGGVDALWHNVQLDALTDAQVAALKEKQKAIIPTLNTFDVLEQFGDGTFHATPLLWETESTKMVEQMNNSAEYIAQTPEELLAWIVKLKANHAGRRENVAKFAAAGIPLLVGTDSNGSDGCFPAHFHLELQLMARAGVENADVLLGATSRAAQFLFGPSAPFGTVEAGKRADLLLVNGDPLVDVSTLEDIATVMAKGRLVRRTGQRPH